VQAAAQREGAWVGLGARWPLSPSLTCSPPPPSIPVCSTPPHRRLPLRLSLLPPPRRLYRRSDIVCLSFLWRIFWSGRAPLLTIEALRDLEPTADVDAVAWVASPCPSPRPQAHARRPAAARDQDRPPCSGPAVGAEYLGSPEKAEDWNPLRRAQERGFRGHPPSRRVLRRHDRWSAVSSASPPRALEGAEQRQCS